MELSWLFAAEKTTNRAFRDSLRKKFSLAYELLKLFLVEGNPSLFLSYPFLCSAVPDIKTSQPFTKRMLWLRGPGGIR